MDILIQLFASLLDNHSLGDVLAVVLVLYLIWKDHKRNGNGHRWATHKDFENLKIQNAKEHQELETKIDGIGKQVSDIRENVGILIGRTDK